MKKVSFSLSVLLLLLACHSSNKKTAQVYTNSSSTQDFTEGKQVYDDFCINCHMANGEGVRKVFPPLANSDYLNNKRTKSIKAIKYGMSGEIIVNGQKYNGAMTPQGLSDEEIAHVMNYITNSWGNTNTTLITEEEVSKVER